MICFARALALALFACLVLAPAGHAQTAPSDPQPGVVVTTDFENSPVDASQAGAKWVKYFVPYSTPAAELTALNRIFTQLKAQGIKVVVVLYGSSAGNLKPPPNPEEFARFAARVAEVVRDSVHGYMVWNEADEKLYWEPAPDPVAYVALLKQAYRALKSADPDGVVSFTPLTGGNYPFLEQAYKVAPDLNRFYDVIGVDTDTACDLDSPYDLFRDPMDNFRVSRFVFLGYREVRNVMAANGAGDKKIWLEMGWSTSTKICNQGEGTGKKNGGVSEAQQAQFLREAYHCLREDKPAYVEAAFWFDLKEQPGEDAVDNRFGLLRNNGDRKPSHAAFQEFAAGRDGLIGPCGDLVGPEITIEAPATGTQIAENETLVIRGLASDPRGLARISFSFDGGKPIRNFTTELADNKAVELNWQGARNLPLGKHTIEITALDRNANPALRSILFEKFSAAALAGKAKFTLGKVRCARGRKCALRGRLTGYRGLTAKNKVSAQWQWKNAQGRYKTLHKTRRAANKPFTFSQGLSRKGRWRVRVAFVASAPFKAVKVKPLRFKVR